ncbi:uncharacterized protein TRIADDRAFT_59818 [Trichoplax adhaerens]|uniref:SH3 domain-containing protein n=1 Tax=Trichoplax adhaerens TaxID=10228 RepID=B3S6I6_TRIAD|nr:hypothetical protein TRIADDRAFT_59818 [Trichoplax adhaerens]EDV21767.1 hypothetical protein TRIADDRAFT_59818 [Trichoplax adhaerens]|eukprot:XP_002115915.1 hypothetical protein TRIADDRAFT_59818 [Trichoplax adhaerens]
MSTTSASGKKKGPRLDEIKEKRERVLQRFNKFKDGSQDLKKKLEDARDFQRFKRNVSELEEWIDEQMKIANDESYKDPVNIQIKVKRHEDFQGVIAKQKDVLDELVKEGSDMIDNEHLFFEQIQELLKQLLNHWEELDDKLSSKGAKLRETQKLSAFTREVDELLAWIAEKEAVASSDDYGRDLEHAEFLFKKFEEVQIEVKTGELRVEHVKEVAQPLIDEDHPGKETVTERIETIIVAWEKLLITIQIRHDKLLASVEKNRYKNAVEDAKQWIDERLASVKDDDDPSNEENAAAIKRKHDRIGNEVAAIEEKVNQLQAQANELCDKFPDDEDEIRAGSDSLDEKWNSLKDEVNMKRLKLNSGLNWLSLQSRCKDYEMWANTKKSDLAEDITKENISADVLEAQHEELKHEIRARNENLDELLEECDQLLVSDHQSSDSIKNKVSNEVFLTMDLLKNLREELLEDWEERNGVIEIMASYQEYVRGVNQVDSWMDKREPLLATDMPIESLDSAQALIKKHENFETTFTTQQEKAKTLYESADKLVDENHYATEDIVNRKNKLEKHIQDTVLKAERRRHFLDDAHQYYNFVNVAEETIQWINEQITTVSDDSYKDLSNMQGKLRKHQAFEAEVSANRTRIDNVNNSGKALIEAEHPKTDKIEDKLDEINGLWDKLVRLSSDKGSKLRDAHRELLFNREVDDMERWIAEVELQLYSEDIGRDLVSVQNLIKKHTLLEADIAAHTEALKAITEQADAFISEEHFHADSIKDKQQQVALRFSGLEDPVSERKAKLNDSLLLFQFLRDVEDEETWIREKEAIASSGSHGRDLLTVQSLIKKHQAMQTEIDNHETKIDAVCADGQKLIDDEHYATNDINEGINKLKDAWNLLKDKCIGRKSELDDSLRTHQYFADSSEAEQWIKDKDQLTSSTDYGKDEDSAQDIKPSASEVPPGTEMKALEDFDPDSSHELSLQKDDVVSVVHAANPKWWKVVKDDKVGFVPASILMQVSDNSSETPLSPVSSLSPTVRPRSVSRLSVSRMSMMGPVELENVASRQQALDDRYNALLKKARERRQKLVDSYKRHGLSREMSELETWIEEKKAANTSAELGNDLDHVEALKQKFDDFLKDLEANETRVNEVNEVSQKLQNEGHSDAEAIRQQTLNLLENWDNLKKLTEKRRADLSGSHDIHKFFRDADETTSYISEKVAVMSSDEVGRDLASVQALMRKHDGIERDIAVLEDKIQGLDVEATKLAEIHPDSAERICAKQSEIAEAWDNLVKQAASRKAKLTDSQDYQQFLNDHRDISSWINGMNSLVSSNELAHDVPGAETLLEVHLEHRTEIDSRDESLQNLKNFGQSLIDKEHYASEDISEKLSSIQVDMQQLENNWEFRKVRLDQCLGLQMFHRDAQQAESWMSVKENFFSTYDIAAQEDTTGSKKRENLDKAFALQEEKINALRDMSDLLTEEGHYDAESIASKRDEILDRWNKLKDMLESHRSKLGQTKTLNQFNLDADEMEGWLNDKLKSLQDDSYQDPAFVQSKLQKQQALEAEVAANEDRIKAVIDMGNDLMANDACSGNEEDVKKRIKDLEDQLLKLKEQMSEKNTRLKEASVLLQFTNTVKDLDFWFVQIEVLLTGEDYGKDLVTVSNILKKHQVLLADVEVHAERVEDLKKQGQDLIAGDHYGKDTIAEQIKDVADKFNKVKGLCAVRHDKLQKSYILFQFYRDIEDEETWISEKKLLMGSEDYGKDLTSVQNLRKNHQRFQTELSGHDNRIKNIQETADKLLNDESYPQADIKNRSESVSNLWMELKDAVARRTEKLEQSYGYQQFMFDVEEEESWINEKFAMVNSDDYGDSLATVQNLLKKHEAFETDLEIRRDRVEKTVRDGEKLVNDGHYQSDNISARCQSLDSKLHVLINVAVTRKAGLRESHNFLQFKWKADVVESWIDDKENQIKSGDYGKDLSSVQALITKLDTFDSGLAAFEQEGIANLTSLKDDLIDSKHAKSDDIHARHKKVADRWENLKNLSADRRGRLLQSQDKFKELEDLFLTFAKKASAFNSWYENAEEDLTDPVRCNSVEEIQALRGKHAQFKDSLATEKNNLQQLRDLTKKIETYTRSSNPYTWFTMDAIEDSWKNIQSIVAERDGDLAKEEERQLQNDKLRQEFAKYANSFHTWLRETRANMVEGSGSLEDQLENTKKISAEVTRRKTDLKKIEDLGARLEEALILDNKYTEHTTVGLAQQWDQLDQLGMRMQHNLEQQIEARNSSGVSEEQLNEFSTTFRHFDKDRSGKLDHAEFKSCLRSLGYDLPVVEEGEKDPEFEAILASVDPNGDGFVTLEEYMAFMISRETENVASKKDVEDAFKALTADGDKPYIIGSELYQSLTKDQADYLVNNMPPYRNAHGDIVPDAFDYKAFTNMLFVS